MLVACGMSHKTAPIDLREKLAFTQVLVPENLKLLSGQPFVSEAAILSTCNRTELYCCADTSESVLTWLKEQHHQPELLNDEHFYCYQEAEAVAHLLRVSSGLDSMAIGEPQILGQVKQAYSIAQKSGTLGAHLDRLFQYVFSSSKAIRVATEINEHPVSIAHIAVNLAKNIFTDIQSTQVLLVGAGETIELVARYLHEQGVHNLVFAGRRLDKTTLVANQFGGRAITMADIPATLPQSDLVYSATASTLPILGKGLLERICKQRKHKPIFMVDLAVPRDIEPEVGELRDVYLYNIDDLQIIIQESLSKRHFAAKQAEAIIKAHTEHFMRQLDSRRHTELIRQFRALVDRERNELLMKSMRKIDNGDDPKQVMVEFARQLSNRLLHRPTLNIRQASLHSREDLLAAVYQLFDLGNEIMPMDLQSLEEEV